MTMQITKELVDSINKALDAGLTKGKGIQVEGQMCVEALICFKMGLPHSDEPPCVGEAIRAAKIRLNDCNWSSNKARAEGMRSLAIAQLGSVSLDQKEFLQRLFHRSCQNVLPLIIEIQIKDPTQKDRVFDLQTWIIIFKKSTNDNINNLWKSFYNCYNYNCYNSDKFLLVIADTILQVLKDMNCEGCKWL